MANCYLDANILFYLQDKESPFHTKTQQIIERLIGKKVGFVISSLGLDEYLNIALKSSGKLKSEAGPFLEEGLKEIFKLPGIKLINPPPDHEKHLEIPSLMAKYNLKPRDAYHLSIMLGNKNKYFATFDKDFKKVFSSKKITPPSF